MSQILNQFQDATQILLDNLYVSPEKFAATLYSIQSTGPFWDRRRSVFSPYLYINNPSICCGNGDLQIESCLISESRPLRKGVDGETFRVRVGGQTYVLKVDFKTRPRISYSKDPPQKYQSRALEKTQLVQNCLYPILDGLKFLGSDSFTNEYLIGLILTETFQRTPGLNGSINFYFPTICSSEKQKEQKGHLLIEYASYGDLVKFTQNPQVQEVRSYQVDSQNITLRVTYLHTIVDLIKQVVSNLDFLQNQLNFNHGDLKARNILVTDEPSEGSYQGVEWRSNFTAKIADFGKSSLTIQSQEGPVRLFNLNPLARTYFALGNFRPDFKERNGISYFTLSESTNATAYANIRHMGNPYFYSFDVYTFLISLFLIPQVYYPVMSHPEIRSLLWEDFWLPEELNQINTKMAQAVGGKNYDRYSQVLDILRGFTLKCQAHQQLMVNLKSIRTI